MSSWRFLGSDDDRASWLAHPERSTAVVEFVAPMDGDRRRVTVATKAWLQARLTELGRGSGQFPCIMLAPMVVVPDATGDALMALVGDAVTGPGVTHFSVSATEDEWV